MFDWILRLTDFILHSSTASFAIDCLISAILTYTEICPSTISSRPYQMVRFLASSNWKYCKRKVYFHTCNLFVNRIRKMVSFELGKEIEKDVLCLQLSRDWDKEKILGSHGIRFLMGTQNISLSQARDKTKNALLHATCCHQKLRGNPKTC